MAEKEKPKEKEKSPEEQKREIALMNFNDKNLMDVAASYLVYKDKNFGKHDNLAMQEFKYFPAFNSGIKAYDENGKEYDVFKNSILASREEGEMYSGNVSELRIMKECAGIMQYALNNVTIKDIMSLMGSKANIEDAYVSNLVPKISKEEMNKLPDEQKEAIQASKELYQNIIGGYQTYLVQTKLSEALAESAKQIPKGLEAILAEPEKKEGGKN